MAFISTFINAPVLRKRTEYQLLRMQNKHTALYKIRKKHNTKLLKYRGNFLLKTRKNKNKI